MIESVLDKVAKFRYEKMYYCLKVPHGLYSRDMIIYKVIDDEDKSCYYEYDYNPYLVDKGQSDVHIGN